MDVILTFDDNSKKQTRVLSLECATKLYLNEYVLVEINPRVVKKCISITKINSIPKT